MIGDFAGLFNLVKLHHRRASATMLHSLQSNTESHARILLIFVSPDRLKRIIAVIIVLQLFERGS